ncbi:MAG: non-canonical purine NTP pyrophosphatase, RdgB/HAM1 family [Legionellales bacterium]|nr:non-canonical purine NTP pyrophosphatase, RdgB/HAM1 family [Legionellales bacterium]OUX65342.1 MAG: non-canonical purine NTP pyrophosphatase, RdgB/HAM1 family [Gammaproteobacteria bacterium TMED281]|tara:strand:+ start:1819 stop:2421 length:603 start_codon:yes stop_codon:yes gene_type:complete
MSKNIVFASHNKGKFLEIKDLFSEKGIELDFFGDYSNEEIEETGLSFHENALLKARFTAQKTSKPALGDDSGLCIQALDQKPGIHSARFAGEEKNFDANIQKVLSLMENKPNRSAYYVCVLAFVRHANDPLPQFFEGLWHGNIASHPEGTNGFGYDPIFIDQQTHQSIAKMPIADKIQKSHRTIALNHFFKSDLMRQENI